MRLVDRDSAPRWARRLAVQFDVGELFIVRSREAVPAFIFFIGTMGAMVGVSSSSPHSLPNKLQGMKSVTWLLITSLCIFQLKNQSQSRRFEEGHAGTFTRPRFAFRRQLEAEVDFLKVKKLSASDVLHESNSSVMAEWE